MNIQVNSESEEEGSSAQKESKANTSQKKRSHFRGDSFGDSVPLENAFSKKDIQQIEEEECT